jgi:two-component system heavy metal sensor histidine kinase CusS
MRFTAAFALAVLAAMLCFGAAVSAVLWLDARAEQRAHPDANADDFDDLHRALAAMAVVSPGVILAAALLGNLLSRRALAPLREASRRARQARDTGGLLELPHAGRGDEWDELAQTLNALLADGRASMERIQRFTADAAHELRNPLTTVLGEAEVALRSPGLEAEQEVAWSAVRDEAERLRRLLEALLALARTDGRSSLSWEEVPLDEVVAEAVARAAASSPALPIRVTGRTGRVRGVDTLLVRAVENLLDNALRHARSKVELALSEEEGSAVLRVRDDGPGVPPEAKARLFERFFRADPSGEATGFGLGLAIVQSIVELHGGTVRYVEQEPGACFELKLPAGR